MQLSLSLSLSLSPSLSPSPSLSLSFKVEIQILDTNDNPPEFSSVNVEYSLVESVPISTVLSPILTATDNDIGTNADITYYLTGEGVPSIFHINTTTAEISLQSSLNYEVKQNYSFTLYAIDGGSLSKRSMNVSVTLIVLDFNDNTPQLTQNTYTKTVNEVRIECSIHFVYFPFCPLPFHLFPFLSTCFVY